jgi:hypothetical protein
VMGSVWAVVDGDEKGDEGRSQGRCRDEVRVEGRDKRRTHRSFSARSNTLSIFFLDFVTLDVYWVWICWVRFVRLFLFYINQSTISNQI